MKHLVMKEPVNCPFRCDYGDGEAVCEWIGIDCNYSDGSPLDCPLEDYEVTDCNPFVCPELKEE